MTLLFSYLCWVTVVKFLALTLVTYFSAHSSHGRFQDINDLLTSNQITLVGFSTLLFLLFIHKLNPQEPSSFKKLIQQQHIEKEFFPGFIQGTIASSGFIILFLATGVYRYLGCLTSFDEAPFEVLNALLRITSLILWIYFEEFIFRNQLTESLQKKNSKFFSSPLACSLWTALFYCLVKVLQFDLGWNHLLSFFLVSIMLSFRFFRTQQFAKGAGLWSAYLIVFHPLFSLPILGIPFNGVILIKQEILNIPGIRFLSGGQGGPLSSIFFQIILIGDLWISLKKFKKNH